MVVFPSSEVNLVFKNKNQQVSDFRLVILLRYAINVIKLRYLSVFRCSLECCLNTFRSHKYLIRYSVAIECKFCNTCRTPWSSFKYGNEYEQRVINK